MRTGESVSGVERTVGSKVECALGYFCLIACQWPLYAYVPTLGMMIPVCAVLTVQ